MSQAIKDFDVSCFIKAAEELLRADETISALNLLSSLPAWYRQNPPKEVTDLKREVQSRVATASFYATSAGYELTAPEDSHIHVDQTLRGALLLKEIQELNIKGLQPHLLDLAPGEYAFCRNLIHNKCDFSYQPSFVNWPSYNHYEKYFHDQLIDTNRKDLKLHPKVYFCGEIIEHLWQEEELRYEMERQIGLADVIHISTPNMTFDFNCTDWRSKGDLGHLRTYTPQEFMNTVMRIFPEYQTQVMVSPILHARCVLKTTQFDIPKEIKL